MILRSTAQTSKCLRRFGGIDPDLVHACLMCPCQALYEWKGGEGLRRKYEIPQDPKIPKKNKTPNIWWGKKKKRFRKRLGRGSINACANFRVLSLKNGVDIELWRDLGRQASKQPVSSSCCARGGTRTIGTIPGWDICTIYEESCTTLITSLRACQHLFIEGSRSRYIRATLALFGLFSPAEFPASSSPV